MEVFNLLNEEGIVELENNHEEKTAFIHNPQQGGKSIS